VEGVYLPFRFEARIVANSIHRAVPQLVATFPARLNGAMPFCFLTAVGVALSPDSHNKDRTPGKGAPFLCADSVPTQLSSKNKSGLSHFFKPYAYSFMP
jgi:hypothetical protein